MGNGASSLSAELPSSAHSVTIQLAAAEAAERSGDGQKRSARKEPAMEHQQQQVNVMRKEEENQALLTFDHVMNNLSISKHFVVKQLQSSIWKEI